MARTWALIEPVQPILHRVSCSNERLPNAPKQYETHKNRSLGSDWVYRVHSLRKLPMRFHATNLCINSTIFSPLCIQFRAVTNNPKCTQTLQNAPKHEFRVQWGGSGGFAAKTCALIARVQPILHRVPCSIETLPNALKCYETQQNKSLGSTLLDRVCSLWKIPWRLHGTNLSINCTGSTRFAPSFM